MKKLLKSLAGLLGYEIARKDVKGAYEHDIDPAFFAAYEWCKPHTKLSRERMLANWNAVKHVEKNGIVGDIVECGVWAGGSAMLMAIASGSRVTWLYDTYAGITEPTDWETSDVTGGRIHDAWKKKPNWMACDLECVRENLRDVEHLARFVKGDVRKTIPREAPERIAVMRLDMDIHAPTAHALEHLYPRLESGGVIIVDDYGNWSGVRRAVDDYFGRNGVRMYLHRIDSGARIGTKP